MVINVSPTIEIRVGLMKCARFQTGRQAVCKTANRLCLQGRIQHGTVMWPCVPRSCATKGNDTPPEAIYDKVTLILPKSRQWHDVCPTVLLNSFAAHHPIQPPF